MRQVAEHTELVSVTEVRFDVGDQLRRTDDDRVPAQGQALGQTRVQCLEVVGAVGLNQQRVVNPRQYEEPDGSVPKHRAGRRARGRGVVAAVGQATLAG